MRNTDPSIPYKIGYKPEIYRPAPQYPHVRNRGYWRISTIFRSFFIVCLASEIFSLVNCGSQLLSFFYRTWVPFKSIKKRKRRAVNYKILPCFDSLIVLFQFRILNMKGVKSCSGLSGFSLRSHHKKAAWSQVNPVFISRFYDEQTYIYCSFPLLASCDAPEFSVQILVSKCFKNTEYTLSKTTKN